MKQYAVEVNYILNVEGVVYVNADNEHDALVKADGSAFDVEAVDSTGKDFIYKSDLDADVMGVTTHEIKEVS